MPGVLAALGSGFVAVALLAGCDSTGPAPAGPPNVLLISVDTLRPDDLGLHGFEGDTSPFIDSLGLGGVVFENATSTAAWTSPAHASLFSGLFPTHHGVRSFARGVPRKYGTLASLLKKQGYATAAVFNLAALRALKRGFDVFWLEPHAQHEGAVAEVVADRGLRWLAGAPRPWFLFLHFYDVHSDYRPEPRYARRFVEPYDGPATGDTLQLRAFRLGEAELGPGDVRHLRNLYRAGIRQLDDDLRGVFARLRKGGHLENTLVVLTSDHGEEFFDHGSVLHGRTLHQELVRVPLIFHGPGIPPGVRVEEPVSLVDLLPTLLSLVGAPPSPGIDGVDVSGLWKDGGPTGRVLVSEADHWIDNKSGNFRRALRRGPWTLHYDADTDGFALYDLRSDPTEQRDVAGQHPELVAELRAELLPYIPRTRPEPQLQPPEDLVEALRQLGYVEDEEPGGR